MSYYSHRPASRRRHSILRLERLEDRRVLATPPTIAVDLTNDTGRSSTDNISMDVAISGLVTDDGFIDQFTATFLDAPVGTPPVDIFNTLGQPSGLFSLDRPTLDSIRLLQFGQTLVDGDYGIQIRAVDDSGLTGTTNFFFTLDTVGPPAPVLALPPAFDPDQDGVTSFSQVTIVGNTAANADVTLDRGPQTTLSNNQGNFDFQNVPLFVGTNVLTATAFDAAGNGASGSITVIREGTQVNQPPSFTAGPDITVQQNSGAQMFPNWATNISPGPNDAGQTVNFLINTDNAGLFSVSPQISSSGTLTFTPATNVVGSALVTVRAHDNGGTTGGGDDTSDPQTFRITVTAVVADGDGVGFYDPAQSQFFLKFGKSPGLSNVVFNYGAKNSGWVPLTGDWNADGVQSVGFYAPQTSTFFLKNSNSQGLSDNTFNFGPANTNWRPIVGDWNGDGVDSIGFYDPTNSRFFLKNSNAQGVSNVTFNFGPANSGWIPLAGDWNGDGVDSVGFYDPFNSRFFLRNAQSQGVSDLTFSFGPANSGWRPLVGDWNDNGSDSIGFYSPQTSTFFLRNTNSQGLSDITFSYGPANTNWVPLVGDWNGTGALASTNIAMNLPAPPAEAPLIESNTALGGIVQNAPRQGAQPTAAESSRNVWSWGAFRVGPGTSMAAAHDEVIATLRSEPFDWFRELR